MKHNLSKLIDVKSLITLASTLIFGYLSLKGSISSEQFLTIFTTIVAFYFGTQHQKKNS